MILLEMQLEGNDFDDLVNMLPKGTYTIVYPKYVDGQALIQVLIDLSKVIIPSLVTYFLGRRSRVSMTWKYHGKLDLEMTAAINKKEISEEKLYKYFMKQVNDAKRDIISEEGSTDD